MSDQLPDGTRVRVRYGRDKGRTGTVFSSDGAIHFVILDGDDIDVSFPRMRLEVIPDA